MIFLVIFVAVFGNQTISQYGTKVKLSTYYVPRLIALGIVSGAFINLVMSVTTQRETGILKRRRAAPVPAWALIAARAVTAVITSMSIVIVLCLIGRLAYGVKIPTATLPGLILTVVVGSVAFACIGFAVASLVNSEEAAQPVVQLITLPLYFLSGIFVPDNQIPKALHTIASVFPLRPLGQALAAGFNPVGTGPGIMGGDLAIIAAWGVAGLLLALWRFGWEPRGR